MADLERKAEATWHGDLKEGKGTITAESGVLKDVPYSFGTRFENAPGTNPEELVAAAHAACYSMALSNLLSSKEHKVHHIHTQATVTMSGGAPRKITKIHLDTKGKVEDIDAETFKTNAEEAKRTCPVSVALSAVDIELTATLE